METASKRSSGSVERMLGGRQGGSRTRDRGRQRRLPSEDPSARIAHELKAPLSIILALCSELELSGLDAEQAGSVDRIGTHARRVALGLDDLLTPEPSCGVQATREELDLRDVAVGVAREVDVLARAEGKQLNLRAWRPVPVWGDAEALRSAVLNLLLNALRCAAPNGTIRCSVGVADGMAHVEVADDGPGIPLEEREAVLQPRLQGSGPRGISGLGLAIVDEVATAHAGHVEIGDAPEGGALVTIALPTRRQPPASGPRHAGPSPR